MDKYLEAYPAVLNVRDVAEILGVGDALVRQLIREHKLVAIRVGRLLKIPKERLIDYLEGRSA